MIEVTLFEHVPHLRRLRQLESAWLNLSDTGPVDDLTFLRGVPPVSTIVQVRVDGPVDLAPLADCPALWLLTVFGGEAQGVEALSRLASLRILGLNPPGRGRDLSFLGDCPALADVNLQDCAELTDLSVLLSSTRLERICLQNAKGVRDLRVLTGLAGLRDVTIADAPLSGGLEAVLPVLDRLTRLHVRAVPTVTSLDVLAESRLDFFNLGYCPVTDLGPLSALQSLHRVWLGGLSAVDLAPLAVLPHLRDLWLSGMTEPIDLSPFARIGSRLRIHVRNTVTFGDPGPRVKIRKL